MTPCSLCERPVLGLTGHDWNLLPWMLAPRVTEGDARPGLCHIRCLRELGVGRRWAGAVEDYHRRRWPQWRTGSAGGVRWRLHCSPSAGRFHLWRADGRLGSFPLASFTARERAGLPIVTEIGEVGAAYPGVPVPAIGAPMPLGAVVGVLGLADRYPGVGGVLLRRPGRPGILEASYRLRLDAPVLRAAAELIRALV